MNKYRELVVPALVGSVLGALGTLLLSIYTDLLPSLLPGLQLVSVTAYLKIIALLVVLFGLTVAVAIVFYFRAKGYRPRVMFGEDFGFEWSAELDYRGKRREEVEIELQFLCPKHHVFLGAKGAEVPDAAYYRLWCAKCDCFYEMMSAGSPVYIEEAERIIRRKILSRLRLDKVNLQ
jgi:hypothetical protein